MSVLDRLFKTYCCTFYGSQIWQSNSQSINSVCTSWNKVVRRILNLPHDAHTWLLGPLLEQNHTVHYSNEILSIMHVKKP